MPPCLALWLLGQDLLRSSAEGHAQQPSSPLYILRTCLEPWPEREKADSESSGLSSWSLTCLSIGQLMEYQL